MDALVIVKIVVGVALGLATLIFLLNKCFFLTPYRLGWLVFISNTVYDTFWKKWLWQRWQMEPVAYAVITIGWAIVAGPWVALAVALVLALAWAWTLYIDLRWRGSKFAHQSTVYGKFAPVPIPHLILHLWGPVRDRGRICKLGDWPEGHQAEFEAIIINPSLVRPQFPMKLEVTPSSDLVQVLDAPEGDVHTPEPERMCRLKFRLRAAKPGGPVDILVKLTHHDHVRKERLRLNSVVPKEAVRLVGAEIGKWKGGARAAFGWRGDHDMYDPSTFQDTAGLKMAFGLARRFFLPSTVYLSGRLALVEDEHRKFCEHFGWNRHTEEIPEFIRFIREQVHVQAEMDFPFECDRPYYAEIGNHMYHHYGTHASAAEENDWRMCTIGDGKYSWQGEAKDDYHEQLDNCAKCNEVFQEKLGFFPMSFAVPGRDYSENTPRAVEDTGIRVGSDSDASQWINVMKLPRPHHPEGVERLVDVTKKYPGDCHNIYRIAVLWYWMHAARRAGGHFLHMAHQHMLRYFDNACYHLTERMLHYVLDECHGDFYVSTVSGIAMYWERVLCPEHRVVKASVQDGSVAVENTGAADLDRLPVEVELAGGRRFMALVDAPAGDKITVSIP
ncbi:MAG: hypothetical protein ACYTF6_00635 [Planctomycetota bacterium]|jgi:hypothetical protein